MKVVLLPFSYFFAATLGKSNWEKTKHGQMFGREKYFARNTTSRFCGASDEKRQARVAPRMISLLSHFVKTCRKIFARRLRVVMGGKLRDTQAFKHNEGCIYNAIP